MYLLDTDILIWAIRGKSKIIERISSLRKKSPTCISTISIAEIYKNIYPAELTATDDLLMQNIIFPVDVAIAKQAGLYWQQFSKRFSGLNLPDCFVAATALLQNASLVTLNTRHFPMKDIKVMDPLK